MPLPIEKTTNDGDVNATNLEELRQKLSPHREDHLRNENPTPWDSPRPPEEMTRTEVPVIGRARSLGKTLLAPVTVNGLLTES